MQPVIDIPVPAKLQSLVRQAWCITPSPQQQAKPAYTFFADGSPGLLFYAAPSGLSVANGRRLTSVLVYGQTIKPVTLTTEDNSSIICVSFHSHAWPTLFDIPADELTDSCIELELFPAAQRISLPDMVGENQTLSGRINSIFHYLVSVSEKRSAKAEPALAYAASILINNDEDFSIKKICSGLNCTERTLERRFRKSIGLPPRLFSTIAKFQRSLQQLAKGKFELLSDVAYQNGYADQSHFIRHFKRFTGYAPLGFYREMAITQTRFPLVASYC